MRSLTKWLVCERVALQSRTGIMEHYSRSLETNNIRSLPGIRYRKLRGRCLSVGFIFLPWLLFLSGSKLLGNTKPEAKRGTMRIRTLVDRLRQDLSITEKVFVSIVPKNDKLVSVERSRNRRGAFVLSFDENFLSTLDDSELSASIAHELGHVWIFTHHPYLQTELLANQIALRAVSRENLEKVYEKVWKDKGKGDLKEFLGEETAVGLKPEIRIKSLPKTTDNLTNK
jgi:hypothetical protein